MKKIFFLTLALIVTAGGVYFYDHPGRLAQIKDAVVSGDIIDGIISVENVIAPPPLRFSGSASGTLDAKDVIAETNKRRLAFNQGVVTENALLDAAAEMKLNDMVEKQYFEHVSPDGKGPSDLAESAGYAYIVIGENLALGNFADNRELLDAWMNSPGHRANILNPKFKEMGAAVGQHEFQGKKVWLAVQEFGKPASECPSLDAKLKTEIDAQKSDLSAQEKRLNMLKAELENNHPRNAQESKDYNESVHEYNNLVEIYTRESLQLKSKIDQFNVSVREYNACIAA